jgi:hypothetical protein
MAKELQIRGVPAFRAPGAMAMGTRVGAARPGNARANVSLPVLGAAREWRRYALASRLMRTRSPNPFSPSLPPIPCPPILARPIPIQSPSHPHPIPIQSPCFRANARNVSAMAARDRSHQGKRAAIGRRRLRGPHRHPRQRPAERMIWRPTAMAHRRHPSAAPCVGRDALAGRLEAEDVGFPSGRGRPLLRAPAAPMRRRSAAGSPEGAAASTLRLQVCFAVLIMARARVAGLT